MSVRFCFAASLDSPLDTLTKVAYRMIAVLLLDVNSCFGRPTNSATKDRDTELQNILMKGGVIRLLVLMFIIIL